MLSGKTCVIIISSGSRRCFVRPKSICVVPPLQHSKDTCPVLPLTAGWCILINSIVPGDSRGSISDPTRCNTSGMQGNASRTTLSGPASWRRAEFLTQVLVPQPARRLLLIAPPLRIFNYTDRDLVLSFQKWKDEDREPVFFDSELCNSWAMSWTP